MQDNSQQDEMDNAPDEREALLSDDAIMALNEVIRKLPESGRTEFRQTIASMRMQFSDPLLDKLEREHFTDIIAIQSDELRLDYEDRKNSRWIYTGMVVFLVLIAVGFGVFLVLNQMDSLLSDLLTKVSFGLGGFFAGWGGSELWRRRNRQ